MADLTLFEAARAVNEPQKVEVRRRLGVGSDNHNWRGGRSFTQHGYILYRVGVGHPLADVRGYTYEHRYVASMKIGRWLLSGEIVHHINGDKRDNRPENLEVCQGNAGHFVHHRRSGKALRLPGEANPQIPCACGCGGTLAKYDESGRPRRFISGHNDHPAPTKMAVLITLESGPLTRAAIAAELGMRPRNVSVALYRLRQQGFIERVEGGQWQRRK